MTKHT